VIRDPDNRLIHRVRDAGIVSDGVCTMHNGVRVFDEYYCDEHFQIVKENGGVHEPQEERVFQEVLKDIPESGSMLELGSYWSFYSLWFATAVADAKCWMVEPDESNLDLGRRNFELNKKSGVFLNGLIGSHPVDGKPPTLSVDQIMEDQGIERLDILHSDIQGFEVEMLCGATKLLRDNLARYIFISTHSNDLHKKCRDLLEAAGYSIVASANLSESFCFDGVLVACDPKTASVLTVPISSRRRLRYASFKT